MELHFTEHFEVDPALLEAYGAFNISVVSDLPMFIDPFLLFNSEKSEYGALHQSILRYLIYLRDCSGQALTSARIRDLYQFSEVRQNWLGFTVLGNDGRGLGRNFATALHASLGSILSTFGNESITASSHLEKLCLIDKGVGRDSISDFTTNLVKDYLCEYTQEFARKHIRPEFCREFAVTRASFNYETETWQTLRYVLPELGGDFVLLTPVDILTTDETWINRSDMIRQYSHLPIAAHDDQLRSQVDHYFRKQLSAKPTPKEKAEAAAKTYRQFPVLIDLYLRIKEDEGDLAEAVSAGRVAETDAVFVEQLKKLVEEIGEKSKFFDKPISTYEEALLRAEHFKHYIENQDGYRLINRNGQPFSTETEVQLFFGLVWFGTDFDVNREPNNGRGPVDYKISHGAADKSLIEFKLGSNKQLERNLQNQLPIYEAANQTDRSIKVIVCYTASQQERVARILKRLGLTNHDSIITIDARSDNKPSASKA